MRGYIRKRGKNYQLTIWVGKKPDGRPSRHFETIRGSKADAQRRLRELLSEIDRNTYTAPSHMTLAQLLDQWLDGYCRTKCSMRTQDSYEYLVRCHLVPAMGHIKLDELQPRIIQNYYGKACENVSNRTVLHTHRVLSQALKWAVRQGYAGKNPAELTDPPTPLYRNMTTLSSAEVSLLLEHAQGNDYYPVIYTAISTGLRRNEILGLRWRDVDLLMASISVSQVLYKGRGRIEFKEPKTEHSRRRVAMTPKLAIYLREHKERQEQSMRRPLTLDDLVFSHPDGTPLDPSTVSHSFNKIVKAAGLKVRFHDLRHSCASLMLREGIHPKIVSEMLGHSSVAITLDIYSHVTPGLQEAAAKSLNEVLPAGVADAMQNSVK